MEPLSALSLASAVIQIVDFSSKVIVRTREVYRNADGTIEETTLLEDATTSLNDLLTGLQSNIASDSFSHKASKQGTPDRQLLQLAEDSQTLAVDLRKILKEIKQKKDGKQRNAFSQGFRSVFEQNKIVALKEKLDEIRKQIDTALLFSLRQERDSVTQQDVPEDVVAQDKVDLLTLVERHNWQPTERDDLMEFSNHLVSLVNTETEKRFANMILGRLYFVHLPARYETIPKAHQETFEWVFESSALQHKSTKWDSFSDWISATNNRNVYWATGKPGSGKSTLMKFMFNHKKTWEGLQAWSQGTQLVKSGFFFWNSGTVMQMSRMGLLQSLLHGTLSNDRRTILWLFRNRWHQFAGFGGGRQPFTWPELRQAFDTMVATPETPRKYFFMIDGLDEFDGNPKEIIDLILGLAKYSHVKMCVASRPWLVFADAFEDRPSLRLEQLTNEDIRRYIASFFANNKHYTRLSKLEPVRASTLISDMAEKSQGVFLWVYLVVQSLLDGLSNADRMSDLVARLDATPPDLEELYAKLLRSLDAQYFKHACQLFRLVQYYERPPLLDLYFADTEEGDSALRDEIQDLSAEQLESRLETMHRRLISRCKGFLEIATPYFDPTLPETRATAVDWIHRTAKDFLRTGPMWKSVLEATGHDSFDPEQRWANGFLSAFKSTTTSPHAKWFEFKGCFERGKRLKHQDTHIMAYLDEVGRTAMLKCPEVLDGELTHTTGDRIPEVRTVLDFAVWFRLVSYITIKAPTMKHQEIVHAAKFVDLRLQNPYGYASNEYDVEFNIGAHRYAASHQVHSHWTADDVQNALQPFLNRRSSWRRARVRLFGSADLARFTIK